MPEKLPLVFEEKVAIVGGGPAGLSCARDLTRYGYATTVFEALPVVARGRPARLDPSRVSVVVSGPAPGLAALRPLLGSAGAPAAGGAR